MKGLSCNSSFLHELPVEQAINVLAEHGYDAIDISFELAPPLTPTPKPHMTPADDAAKRQRVRRSAEQAGIAIAASTLTSAYAHSIRRCARETRIS